MESAVIYCPNCGAENDADARFCSACGRDLKDVQRTVADRMGQESRSVDPDVEQELWTGRPSWLMSPGKALTQRYRLTNLRLIVTYGLISRRTEEVDLFRVNDVSVKQNPLERILGRGDVTVFSADSSTRQLVLHNVANQDEVKDTIRRAAREERDRRRVLVREEF